MANKHDIFLSYSRKDKARVQSIVQLLEQQGWSVWWDPKIPHGIRFGDHIEEQLDNSSVVVVVWSNHSIKSKWVKEEASEGDHKNALFPLNIDTVRPPLGFRGIQTANFVDWIQQNEEVKWFLSSLKERLGTNILLKSKPPKLVVSPPIINNFQDLDGKNGRFIDARDGQIYKTIKIGKQIWMAENLNFKVEGSWWYLNKKEIGDEYGRLYTWEAAKKVCPKGWHLPTDAEWKTLLNVTGGYYDNEKKENIGDPKKAHKALMEGGSSKFAALCGGIHFLYSGFNLLGEIGYYWSATAKSTDDAWGYSFGFGSFYSGIKRNRNDKESALSCRCLQD